MHGKSSAGLGSEEVGRLREQGSGEGGREEHSDGRVRAVSMSVRVLLQLRLTFVLVRKNCWLTEKGFWSVIVFFF